MLQIPRFKSFYPQAQSLSEENKRLKQRAFSDFAFFIREFFPHHFWGQMSEMHLKFCDIEKNPDRRGVRAAFAAPRGHAKTTFQVLIKAIHAIVYGYHPFIVIVGYSSAEAIDKVKDIRDELLTNEKLRAVYGKILTDSTAKSDFTTKNGVRVVARSRGGQIRGLKHGASRPSLILLDDIESLETVNTPEQRQKTRDWFYKDVMGAGRADGQTSVTVVGTIMHPESLLAELLQKPGWLAQKYQAVKQFSERRDLWDAWKVLYCNLDSPTPQQEALAFYEQHKDDMLAGTEVLWASEDYYRLQEFIIQYGLAAFYSEKQNQPYDPEKQILDPDICQRFRVLWPQDTDWPQNYDKHGFLLAVNGELVESGKLKVIAFHDPALAETSKSDYAAIVVCAQDLNGYIYVLDCYLRRDPVARQIQKAYQLCAKWGIETLYLETVGFQELLKPLYIDEQQRQEQKIKIVGVHQHHNKVHRIGTLEPYLSNGWLKLNDTLDPILLDQLRLFPTTHDDGPDALHGCVDKLKKPGGHITISQSGAFIR